MRIPHHFAALRDAWVADLPPRSIAELALIEQGVVATIDKRRCIQARTAILAERVRTADYRFDLGQDDLVESYKAMLVEQPAQALIGLTRSAAGTRYLILRWERLDAILKIQGTWYGHDRDEVIRLQGVRAGDEHRAASETAYVTWFYCLIAQTPKPQPPVIATMVAPGRIPETFRVNDPGLWVGDPNVARESLRELVTLELTTLRAREAWLREHVEEPARATAREQARVHTGPELAILKAERWHDQSFQQAYLTLRKGRPAAEPGSASWTLTSTSESTPAPTPPRPDPNPGPIPSLIPVFFDFHSCCRAVLAVPDGSRKE